jgi:uncharacterized protein (DUF1810 family)
MLAIVTTTINTTSSASQRNNNWRTRAVWFMLPRLVGIGDLPLALFGRLDAL